MGCRLNDYVEVTDTARSRYEVSWVPAARIDDFMNREVAFVTVEQRNAAVPASHVTERLPPTLVLIADDERSFPPILRDAAAFAGRALIHGVEADIAILAGGRHVTAIQMMVTAGDTAMVQVTEFVRSL
jgi:acetyl esterase/lipase